MQLKVKSLEETGVIQSQKLGIVLLICYLATLVFEGPLRFALSYIGLQWVLYCRDLIMVGFVTLVAIFGLGYQSLKIRILLLLLFFILSAHTIWGFIHLESTIQVLFGIKMFIPIFFGVACFESFQRNIPKYWKIFLFLLLASGIGVIVNYYVEMPWANTTYEVAGFETKSVKDWYAGDLKRLYGFGRASGTVAVQLLVLWAISVCFIKSLPLRVLVTLIALIAVALTTTKGVWLAFGVIFFYLFMSKVLRISSPFRRFFLFALGYSVIIIPMFFLVFDFKGIETEGIWRFVFSSFVDRGVNMWPNVATLLSQEGVEFFGRGVGGAGTPQMYFEYAKYNPGDNLFMYFWLIFGVFSIVYLFVFILGVFSLDFNSNAPSVEKFFILFAIGFFIYSITTSVIEGGEFSCFAGILLGRIVSGSLRSLDSHPSPFPALVR